jgi:hypothetical protein
VTKIDEDSFRRVFRQLCEKTEPTREAIPVIALEEKVLCELLNPKSVVATTGSYLTRGVLGGGALYPLPVAWGEGSAYSRHSKVEPVSVGVGVAPPSNSVHVGGASSSSGGGVAVVSGGVAPGPVVQLEPSPSHVVAAGGGVNLVGAAGLSRNAGSSSSGVGNSNGVSPGLGSGFGVVSGGGHFGAPAPSGSVHSVGGYNPSGYKMSALSTRVPSPTPNGDNNSPVAENWCYTQVSFLFTSHH